MVHNTTINLILSNTGLGGGDKTFKVLYKAIKIQRTRVKKTLYYMQKHGTITLTGTFFKGTWHKV